MPRGSAFTLGNGSSWPNKTKAKAHFSAMLNRYQSKQTVSEAQDHAELLSLVTTYDGVSPEWAGVKTGAGVASFIKDHDDDPARAQFSTMCFFVVRTDGSKVHFSTNKAVDAIASVGQ